MWGAGPLTGAALDAIVAGPNRAPPPKPPPAPKKPLITWGEVPEEPIKVVTPATTTAPPRRTAVRKQSAPTRDARERNDAYSEMVDAANERGNYLDDLGETMNQASISAANYLTQARNAAVSPAHMSVNPG